jgi:hypothetical protein
VFREKIGYGPMMHLDRKKIFTGKNKRSEGD